jgi:hypothetical protein
VEGIQINALTIWRAKGWLIDEDKCFREEEMIMKVMEWKVKGRTSEEEIDNLATI